MAETTVTLVEALAKLKEYQEKEPDFINAGATDEEIEAANAALPVPIPALWRQVLQTYNGFSIGNTNLVSVDGICLPEDAGPTFIEKRAPAESYYIGGYDSGDAVMLDIARQTPDGDCPVIWIFHEDSEIGSGESIADFLMTELEIDRTRG